MTSKTKDKTTPSRQNAGVATIYDVAQRAGVSPMTVSRVVNGERNVRPATRAAVQRAIKDLQFRPNMAARRLAGAVEPRIGLLYNNPSVAYFTEFLMGALEGCSRNSAQLVLDKCKISDPDAAIAAVHKLIKGGINGMVLTSPITESAELITELKAHGISTIAVGMAGFRGDVSRVGIDDFRATYEMTHYLIGRGHKKIGFIQGHPRHTASLHRMMGFEAAIRDAGSKARTPIVVQGDNTYRSGVEAGKKLLSGTSMPTAIFASNDDMASGVLLAAHRKGIEVPGDLSVVGFDDTVAGSLWPALTTVRQPIFDIASISIDVITRNLREIRAGRDPECKNHSVPHSLVERESVATKPG